MACSHSKEIQDFVTDLYSYLWTKHKFQWQTIDQLLNERLHLANDQIKEDKIDPVTDVGNAVFYSQYLLRDLCRSFFDHPLYGFDDDFLTNISILFVYWTCYRNSIFVIFIDLCAIVAEAVLFCDSESKMFITQERAPELFFFLFESDFMQDFVAKGGLDELHQQVIVNYGYVGYVLQPLVNKFTKPYECLKYNCKLIKSLMDSPIFFPVRNTKVCQYCLEKFDNKSLYYFDVVELYEDCFKNTSLGIGHSKDLCKTQSAEVIGEAKAPESNSNASKTSVRRLPDFICLFVGKQRTLAFNKRKKELIQKLNRKRKMIPYDEI